MAISIDDIDYHHMGHVISTQNRMILNNQFAGGKSYKQRFDINTNAGENIYDMKKIKD